MSNQIFIEEEQADVISLTETDFEDSQIATKFSIERGSTPSSKKAMRRSEQFF